MNKKDIIVWTAVIASVIIIYMTWNYFNKKAYADYERKRDQEIEVRRKQEGLRLDILTKMYMGSAAHAVIVDAEQSYNTAKAAGDHQRARAYATKVVDASLEAGEREYYEMWLEIEKSEAEAVE